MKEVYAQPANNPDNFGTRSQSIITNLQSQNSLSNDILSLERWMRMKYDKEFKLQALKLSDEIGTKAAANELGISYYTLTDWRKARKEHSDQAFVSSGHQAPPLDEKERQIQELEARLRENELENEILKEALGFFNTSRKK